MKSTFLKVLLLSIALILLNEITNTFLDIKGLLYNSLSEQLTAKQLQQYFDFQDKWQWVSYFIIPLLLLIKTSLIASVIFIGTFFSNTVKLGFKQIWGVVLNAEFIFLLVPFFKLIWFMVFQPSYTLEDIQYFYPFSGLNITGYKGLESWLLYPLQVLNLFEIGYVIYLGYQMGCLTQTSTDNGLKIVASSYLPALLLWVSLVMFFVLNYS